MSTTAAAITSAALVLLGLAAAVRLIRRAQRHEQEEQRVTAARARTGLVPPAPDGGPGTDIAALDECQRIWVLPSRHPGFDRLQQAIRDEQPKGDEA